MWLVALGVIALGGKVVQAEVNPTAAGYGRTSCTNYDGTPNYQYCIDQSLPSCAQDPHTLNYFCGLKGSTCDYPNEPFPPFSELQAICDGGYCRPGATDGSAHCVGGLGDTASYGPCIGQLKLNSESVCGGNGAACSGLNYLCVSGYCDPRQNRCTDGNNLGQSCVDPAKSCSTGLYCSTLAGTTCQARVTSIGGSCAFDYVNGCGTTSDGTQLYPSIPSGSTGHADCTCVPQGGVIVRPSSRARARERARRNLSLCPKSHTACRIGNGFECIDTQTNLEQCGGCGGDGGMDCTALEGVAAVGCVGGQCEVWACEEGFRVDREGVSAAETLRVDMSAAPHHLDYTQSTYFVLSTSSSAPPALPSPSSELTSAFNYVGALGDGIMATEHIIALEGVPTGASDRSAEVERIKEGLKQTAGVQHVEVMQAKQRSKR